MKRVKQGTLFTAKDMVAAMKGIMVSHWANMDTIWNKATVVRAIRYFPKGGNQASHAYLVYCAESSTNPLMAINSYYIDGMELENFLPKRIAFIEDFVPMSAKEFEEYMRISHYTNAFMAAYPTSNDVSYYGFHYEDD